jgi:hypothetical protein
LKKKKENRGGWSHPPWLVFGVVRPRDTAKKKKKNRLRVWPLVGGFGHPQTSHSHPLGKKGGGGPLPFCPKATPNFYFYFFLRFLVFRLFYCLILFLMGQFLKSADVDFCQFMDGSIISVFSYKRSIICDMK